MLISIPRWHSSQPNPWRYAGGYADPTGLTKFGTRYYDPNTGRFTQPDPSGRETNAYAYAGMNPVNMNDPDGRLSVSTAVKIIEALLEGRDVYELFSADATATGIEAGFALVCSAAAGAIAAPTTVGVIVAEGGCLALDAMLAANLEDD